MSLDENRSYTAAEVNILLKSVEEKIHEEWTKETEKLKKNLGIVRKCFMVGECFVCQNITFKKNEYNIWKHNSYIVCGRCNIRICNNCESQYGDDFPENIGWLFNANGFFCPSCHPN